MNLEQHLDSLANLAVDDTAQRVVGVVIGGVIRLGAGAVVVGDGVELPIAGVGVVECTAARINGLDDPAQVIVFKEY